MENKIEFKPFDKVLVRDSDDELWEINMFSSETLYGADVWYQCISSIWGQCIHYEGNEHLLGTTDSPKKECTKEVSGKQDEVGCNYGYPVECFKRKDLVLCRDGEGKKWFIDVFLYNVDSASYPFRCNNNVWRECIPYEGNEHLQGTTDTPERYNPNKNTLFGVKLKPGYVLEFKDDELGILFPTANGFAVSYAKGNCQFLKGIKKDSLVRIMGITQTDNLRSGELLWERPQKQAITKAEIAEKLGMKAQDFEIIDEETPKKE